MKILIKTILTQIILLLFKQKILPLYIFIFFFLINISVSGGHLDGFDGKRVFLYTENFALNGIPALNVDSPSMEKLGISPNSILDQSARWSANKYHDENSNMTRNEYIQNFKDQNKNAFWIQFPLILSIVSAPLYLVALSLNLSPVQFVSLFANSTIISVSSLLVFLIGQKLFSSAKIGFILCLIFGLSSFIWPYISTFFPRPIGLMFLLLALYLLLRYRDNKKTILGILCGLSLGLSLMSQIFYFPLAVGVLVYAFIEYRKEKKLLAFLLITFLVLVVVQGTVNYVRFGHPLDFGYPNQTSAIRYAQGAPDRFLKIPDGTYGVLISPGRGLFTYLPVAILYPLGMYYMYKKNKPLMFLFLYITIISYGYIASNSSWDKLGSNWGPHRYMIPIIPFVIFPLGAVIQTLQKSTLIKSAIISLASYGFVVNFLGNLVSPGYIWKYGVTVEGVRQMGDRNAIFAWNPMFSPHVEIIKILNDGWYQKMTGCSYDMLLLCHVGIWPLIIISCFLLFITYAILKILTNPYSQSKN
jgi:hypothetical protein